MDENALPQFSNVAPTDVLQARIAAEDVSTDREILRKLAQSSDKATREAVAANPNAPTDVLLKLAAEFPQQLLNNPIFSFLLLENPNLVAEIPLPSLRSLLRLENVPLFLLEQAADKADVEVQLALTMNIQTSKEVLSRLTQSRDSQVVEAARLHVNFAGELIEGYKQKAREVIKNIIPNAYQADIQSLKVLAKICPIPEYIIERWTQDSSYQDLCRTIAELPNTFPSNLERLANHSNPRMRFWVAQNPNTPVDTLWQLATDKEEIENYGLVTTVRDGLAGNLNTPIEILESLAQKSLVKKQDATVFFKLVENPNTPLTVLEYFLNNIDKRIAETAAKRIAEEEGEYSTEALRNPEISAQILVKAVQKQPNTVASHPNAPSDILSVLSKSKKRYIRENVAKNFNTPTSILEQLAQDDYSEVRRAVVENYSIEITLLEQLAQDESVYVRNAVACNQKTPLNILFKQLARDAQVVSEIANQLSIKEFNNFLEAESIIDILAEESTSELSVIFQRLIAECGMKARLFLAQRYDIPTEILVQLAQADEFKVRNVVAQNPNTPAIALVGMAQDKESKVRQAVAQNPNTPINIIEKLAQDEDSYVLVHVAVKRNLPSPILEKLANCKASNVREKAMVNPDLSKQAVELILCGEYASDYLNLNPGFLAANPDSLAKVLNYYAKSKVSIVSFIALLQGEIDQEMLVEKSRSIYWLERFAIANNPQIALERLYQLAEDSNQLVRAAARDVIRKRERENGERVKGKGII